MQDRWAVDTGPVARRLPRMNASDFVAKRRHVELTERASAHSRFIDLCRLVGHPTPVEADPKREWFTSGHGLTRRTGKLGWRHLTLLARDRARARRGSSPMNRQSIAA